MLSGIRWGEVLFLLGVGWGEVLVLVRLWMGAATQCCLLSQSCACLSPVEGPVREHVIICSTLLLNGRTTYLATATCIVVGCLILAWLVSACSPSSWYPLAGVSAIPWGWRCVPCGGASVPGGRFGSSVHNWSSRGPLAYFWYASLSSRLNLPPGWSFSWYGPGW